MNSGSAIRKFQKTIARLAAQKLYRKLSEQELRFITSSGSFMALEMIHDTIKSESKEGIEQYLNSEPHDHQ